MTTIASTPAEPDKPTALPAEQDQARRLSEWAASPREGLPGWSGYDDEELPTDAD